MRYTGCSAEARVVHKELVRVFSCLDGVSSAEAARDIHARQDEPAREEALGCPNTRACSQADAECMEV